jgi:hypothetical protein
VLPPNCSLTPEQFARLHPDSRNSPARIWLPKGDHLPDDVCDAVLAVCNQRVLPALFRLALSAHLEQEAEHRAS